MKKILSLVIFLCMLIVLLNAFSSKELLSEKISLSEVDKIQVVTAMGNPKYGADSKIITDKEEIKDIVEIFNEARIGKKTKDLDASFPSTYYFYSAEQLICKFVFNGNDTERILLNGNWFYVEYPKEGITPFKLYQKSKTEIVVVDLKLNKMERPKE